MNVSSAIGNAHALVKVNSFIKSVYNWMAIGLALTACTALYVSNSETMLQLIFGNQLVFFGMIFGELGLVFYLSSRVQKMQASTATVLFVLYSILNGATLSCVFLMYTSASIVSTFFVCALTFGACSVYGMVTKRDLTSLGGFMIMGLFGIIIATVVNLFIQSSAMTMIISYIGVVVFIGLTAYDTQKLKQMALTLPDNASGAMVRKGTIMGALTLYLDFINLFIMLLHIFGISRD
ncbi:MAG: Bax inhibitor-1/YccA family protein [Thermodesulfobacteriota bacterium]|nr:Bax inhibitor-1/YccA family protein [Thermodesulfobacteriota bacterium]